MTETNNCPKCGTKLPANAPSGICPKCLMEAGMASDTELHSEQPEGEPTTPFPTSSGFVPPEPDELAEHFPQLEILELLGKGGMGAVYKARQRELDRVVAVKILPPEVGQDSAFAERFMREARALAKLSHQNIVSVFDFGQAKGLYYFIMEFVDGANLRHVIQAGEIKPEEALAIVPQICNALQFAHDEGVVHRDIKPENILINKQGRVKIADFGLAKLLGQAPAQFPLTGTHQVMGTLHYMAPEQMQGSRTVDHRADIYSLGVVFYEMLTGTLPVGRFDPPSKKVQVDVRLDNVVLRALENEPQRRYQHAEDVKTDVDSIVSDPNSPVREHLMTADDSASREPLTISNLWSRLTLLPTRLTCEALALFIIGWIITGASWNYGPWALLAGGCAMTALSWFLAKRCRQVLPGAPEQPEKVPWWTLSYWSRSWSRHWVDSNILTGLLLGWFLFVAVTINLVSLLTDFLVLNGDPTDFVASQQGQEHRLIRQLTEFKQDVPDVELIGKGYRFTYGTTGIAIVWACFFLFSAVMSAASGFRGVLEGNFKGLLGPYWRPTLAMAGLMGTSLLLVLLGVTVISLVINASGGGIGRTARVNANVDKVMATIEQWLDDQDYNEHFSNSWRLDTVPDGKTVARVERLGCSQGWFDRWSVRWNGLTQRTPALEIRCLASVANKETIVRIKSSMGRKDSGTLDRWEPLVDSLKLAIESVAVEEGVEEDTDSKTVAGE